LPDYGLPADLDPLEGWIASVPAANKPGFVCERSDNLGT